MIANTGKILDATAADHNDRMLLKIMALTGDVARDFEPVGQAHTRDLSQGRVRLLRCGRIDTRANTTLLRARLEGGNLVPFDRRLTRLADQLVDRRHMASLILPVTFFVNRLHKANSGQKTFLSLRAIFASS